MRQKKKPLTLPVKVFIIKTYYDHKDVETVRSAIADSFDIQTGESFCETINKIVDTFEITGSVTQPYFYEVQKVVRETNRVTIMDEDGEHVLYNVIIEKVVEKEDDEEVIQVEDQEIIEQDNTTDRDEEDITEEQEEFLFMEKTPNKRRKSSANTEDIKALRKERLQKKHRCRFCNKEFSGRYLLSHYKKTHKEKAIYACQHCDQSFAQWSDYKAHKVSHEKAPLVCEPCDKTFVTTSSYNRHMKVHTEEKPHVCNFCSKSFREAVTLKLHIRCHTGEKPYSCTICLKSFSTKSSWTVHNRVHTGEKPYKCQYCEKAFSDSSTRNVSEEVWLAN